MKTSEKGKAIIKEFEGLHDGDLHKIGLQPKMDPSGIWTEGWGRAMVYNGKFLKGAQNKNLAYQRATIKTLDEAEKALDEDLIPREKEVLKRLKVGLNQNQFDAIMSFYYNCGYSETLFRLINSKAEKTQLHNWWSTHYITSEGVKLAGLIKRRKKEADLYFS